MFPRAAPLLPGPVADNSENNNDEALQLEAELQRLEAEARRIHPRHLCSVRVSMFMALVNIGSGCLMIVSNYKSASSFSTLGVALGAGLFALGLCSLALYGFVYYLHKDYLLRDPANRLRISRATLLWNLQHLSLWAMFMGCEGELLLAYCSIYPTSTSILAVVGVFLLVLGLVGVVACVVFVGKLPDQPRGWNPALFGMCMSMLSVIIGSPVLYSSTQAASFSPLGQASGVGMLATGLVTWMLYTPNLMLSQGTGIHAVNEQGRALRLLSAGLCWCVWGIWQGCISIGYSAGSSSRSLAVIGGICGSISILCGIVGILFVWRSRGLRTRVVADGPWHTSASSN